MTRVVGAVWRCKVRGCRTWGLGGPDGWIRHQTDLHQQWDVTARLGADLAFGFTPDHGMETRA